MADQELPCVLVSGFEGPCGVFKDHIGDLKKHFRLITMKEFLENKTQLSQQIQAVYIWGGKPVIDCELLQSLPSLKIIASAGVGVDHLDLPLIASFGVKVANTPDAVSSPTADLGMTLLLAAARRLLEGCQLALSPETESFSINWMGQGVTGATLGIVGMGSIGYKVAQRAKAFEMKILYHNRNRRPQEEEEAVGATYCEKLEDLLPQSDFVMLALRLTPETRGLLGRRELALMKPTAVLVNIGRGLLIDQDALVEALQTGVIHAAALDVTHPEPLPRKKFWYEGPSLGHLTSRSPKLEALMTRTARKTRKEDHVRLRALNGLLHKALAELLSTPEVSQEICDLCVEVSKVSVSPDFSACRVYWKTTLSAAQNQRTEAALQRSAAHIRHLLMAQQTLRNVPPVVFVQDKESAAMAQIDQLLATADFGPPAGRDDSGQDPLRNPDSPSLCDTPAPAVHPSLCGIDHEALNKQITEYKRRKEKGRGSRAELTAGEQGKRPEPHSSHPSPESPVDPAA